MRRKVRLTLVYYLVLTLITLLTGFWLYLNFSNTRFEMIQAENVEEIQRQLATQSSYDFAVVGNVKNSVRTFRDQIIPIINDSDLQFVVSAGNAVSDGGEENYRSAIQFFSELNVPFLWTYGENENAAFGNVRFYEMFGPHFFAFEAGQSHFIFLDGTGNTSLNWQLMWLERELRSSRAQHRFVFISAPLHEELENTPPFETTNYFDNDDVRDRLIAVFAQYDVSVVLSSGLSLFHETEMGGVHYVTTGGAGGVILNQEHSYHHYVRVAVDGDALTIEPVRFDVEQWVVLRTLDSIWSAVYTFFYVSYIRFFLILGVLIAISIRLWQVLFEERNFYPDFDIDFTPYLEKKKRVAVFTNNYFPFISGVTISIQRLAQGLRHKGHDLLVVAPTYDKPSQDDDKTVRVRTVFSFGDSKEFRLANVFQSGVSKRVKQFKPDLIHLHHPFCLGSLGLWIARRRKIPAVYTYHTRLEMYAHYVPLPGAIFRNLISHLLVRRFCNKCDGVIVPTWSVEEYLRVIGVTTRILVQPTGVDYRSFKQYDKSAVSTLRNKYQLGEDEKVLITVSRLGKEKNISFMLQALARLPEYTEQPYRLLVVGDGVERENLQREIEALDLNERITLVGGVEPDMIKNYYRLADAFVFASKSETQGMVILEAMSAGLPVVAVRASGIDDVIEHGSNGFKTPEKITQWNQCLARLLDDDELRAELAARARLFAKKHDISYFCDNINRFYAELLAAREQEQAD